MCNTFSKNEWRNYYRENEKMEGRDKKGGGRRAGGRKSREWIEANSIGKAESKWWTTTFPVFVKCGSCSINFAFLPLIGDEIWGQKCCSGLKGNAAYANVVCFTACLVTHSCPHHQRANQWDIRCLAFVWSSLFIWKQCSLSIWLSSKDTFTTENSLLHSFLDRVNVEWTLIVGKQRSWDLGKKVRM